MTTNGKRQAKRRKRVGRRRDVRAEAEVGVKAEAQDLPNKNHAQVHHLNNHNQVRSTKEDVIKTPSSKIDVNITGERHVPKRQQERSKEGK